MNDDITKTQSFGMLRRVVLYDTLEAVISITVTTVAQKQLLAVRLGVGLDFHIKHPFHVFESQLLCEGSLWGVGRWLLAICNSICGVLCHV